MFTNNGVAGAGARRAPAVERASLGTILAVLGLDVAGAPGTVIAAACAIAAAANLWRLLLWHPWKTRRAPLVWILHAAYAWIPVVGPVLGGIVGAVVAKALFDLHP